jgi:hypothetical protein
MRTITTTASLPPRVQNPTNKPTQVLHNRTVQPSLASPTRQSHICISFSRWIPHSILAQRGLTLHGVEAAFIPRAGKRFYPPCTRDRGVIREEAGMAHLRAIKRYDMILCLHIRSIYCTSRHLSKQQWRSTLHGPPFPVRAATPILSIWFPNSRYIQ